MAVMADSGLDNKPKKKAAPIRVVLRRLPYTMKKEELLAQLGPLPEYEGFQFVEADPSTLPWAFARAYLAFSDEGDVLSFRDRFNGYVFVDAAGTESMAIVELAPNVKLAKQNRENAQKEDSKCSTVHDDVEYKKFLEERNNPTKTEIIPLDQRLKELEEREKRLKESAIQETPLTLFMVKKYGDRVQKQMEKRRQRDDDRRSRYRDQDNAQTRSRTVKHDIVKTKRQPNNNKPSPSTVQQTDGPGPKQVEVREKKPKAQFKQLPIVSPAPSTTSTLTTSMTSTTSTTPTTPMASTTSETIGSVENKSSRRNKERPERAIYQPNARRRDGNAK